MSQEPEMIQFQDMVEANLQEQKMTIEVMKAHLIKVMKEHKGMTDNQAEIVKRQ